MSHADIHTHLPQPDSPICDFCSSPEPAFDYPTRDVQLEKLAVISKQAGGMVTLNSRGWWCACEECHELIQRADRDGLAERSKRLYKGTGFDTPTMKPMIDLSIRHVQDQFWKSREGAPYKHDLSKVPYAITTLPIPPEAFCFDCRAKSPKKDELYPNFSIEGDCAGCGRTLGYTEDQRLA